MSAPRQDDTERDAWLSEALRHAPDAQAAPPAALSDAILRQARAATNPARAPANAPARGRWADAWLWLARPPVAAGFASVTVATLVGLTWWDQPMDPTIARPPAVNAPPQPSAPAALPLPPPAPTPAPAQALRARESAAPVAAERKADAARDELRALPSAGALARSGTEKAAAPSAQYSDNVADTRPAAFSALLASVAAEPERWRWQRSGTEQPMSPALQRWLARLDAATTSARWRPAAESAASGEAAVLRLYRDGALAATLRLDDATVGLAAGPRARLAPAALATLKKELDAATR